jgi:hypothetical protein
MAMKEIKKTQALTGTPLPPIFLFGLLVFAFCLILAPGCGVKRTVKIEPPQKINLDKSATFDELIERINRYEEIHSLASSSITLTLTAGKIESGRLDKYRSAPGYILLKRPDSLRLVLQAPVTKTSILDLTSVGDSFDVWIPSENRYFIGKNSARQLFAEGAPDIPEIPPIRATHILEAVFPGSMPIGAPEELVSMEEAADADTRYYILAAYKRGESNRIRIIRKIWVERFELTIARQQIYQANGQIVSDIAYSNGIRVNGFLLPDYIHIDRPLDDYSLDIGFKKWSLNPELRENAFIMPPPPKAQIIYLKEKGRSEAS